MNIANNNYDEIKKCLKSPSYFVSNYIVALNPTQEYILDTVFYHNKFNIVLHSKAMNITIPTALYALWKFCFLCDQRILIVTEDDATAEYVANTIKGFIKELPVAIKPSLIAKTYDNCTIITTNTGSRIWCRKAGAYKGVGVDLLIINNAHHIPHMEQQWKSLCPLIYAEKGQCIVHSHLSTKKNVDPWFKTVYQLAAKKQNVFHASKFDCHNVYSPKHINVLKKQVDLSDWNAEYECIFPSKQNIVYVDI